MPRVRRYAPWRSLATRRVPAHWLGTLAGTLAFAVVASLHGSSYVAIVGALALTSFVQRAVASRRLAALRDEAEGRQFAATLRLQRAAGYGHDEGLVSFEDGFLVYMGCRCAFSFGALDVRVLSFTYDNLHLVFKGPGGNHVAHIRLKKNEAFAKAIAEWRYAGKRSRASVFPPVLPNPEFSRPMAMAMSALPLIALAVGLLGIDPPNPAAQDLPFVLSGLALATAAGWSVCHGRELGRLARGERRPVSLITRLRRHLKAPRKPRDRTLRSSLDAVVAPGEAAATVKQTKAT